MIILSRLLIVFLNSDLNTKPYNLSDRIKNILSGFHDTEESIIQSFDLYRISFACKRKWKIL
jgi:hypothetical protein